MDRSSTPSAASTRSTGRGAARARLGGGGASLRRASRSRARSARRALAPLGGGAPLSVASPPPAASPPLAVSPPPVGSPPVKSIDAPAEAAGCLASSSLWVKSIIWLLQLCANDSNQSSPVGSRRKRCNRVR